MRSLSWTVLAGLLLSIAAPVHAGAAQVPDSVGVDSVRRSDRARRVDDAAPAYRLPAASNGLVAPENVLEPIAGRVPAARVRYRSAEPGTLPLLDFRYRTIEAEPLYLFDGIPLVAPPLELPPTALGAIDVIPSLGGTAAHGSRAAGGVVHLRSTVVPPEPGFMVTAHTQVGTSWLPVRMPVNRHHPFLLGPDGGYVDASGNPVAADRRSFDPDGIADNPYPEALNDHFRAMFRPGLRSSAEVGVSRTSSAGGILLAGGHARDRLSVRHGETFTRSHARLAVSRSLHPAVVLKLTALHSRSGLPDIGSPAAYLETASLLPPDVDLLAPSSEYRYDPFPGWSLGPMFNPLSTFARAGDASRARSIVGARAQGQLATWLSYDAGIGLDRIEARTPRGIPYVHQQFALTSATSLLRQELEGRTIDGRLTAQGSRWQADWTLSALVSLDRLRDEGDLSMLNPAEATNPRSWLMESELARAGLSLGARHETGLELLATVRRETTPWHGADDAGIHHVLAAGYDVAAGSLQLPSWLDRAALRISLANAVRPHVIDLAFVSPLPNPASVTAPLDRESEVSVDVGVAGRYAARLTWSAGSTRDHVTAVPLPSSTGFAYRWTNIGDTERRSAEASIKADIVRRADVSWSVDLALDRGRQRVARLEHPPYWDAWLQMPIVPGAVFGELHGLRFLRSHRQLPAVHAASHDAFAVNDDDLLVAVGSGGALTDRSYGTLLTIDGVGYRWGMPIADPPPDGGVFRIGDMNPDLGLGLGSTLRWRYLAVSTVLSGQLGGDAYDNLREQAYRAGTHADVDQSGKPQPLRKPVTYYSALASPHVRTDWFVQDATHLRLRELVLSITPPAGRSMTVSIIGRNLATWTRYGGMSPEGLIPSHRGDPLDWRRDVHFPELRSVSLHVAFGPRALGIR